ncbi:transcriptional regulator, TetR family [Pilibacter termitis]|uniref:Transcriptional regulator, TetR family n=1 Tax=Pilibacter termitis TaxID=263852 RepID=A0A1T4MTL1_9ENTE|nr:TetR/AcrR family transcriptional regulator [Pilibacter termitis]SJZ70313.1 transcriptional regulator, TetR family [Pilibacter termitis]
MARKKMVTREQILTAAHKIVRTKGLSSLTARNIAEQVGCSTQPIYLEFENMGDLRDVLFEEIYEYLEQEVYPIPHTGDPIVDLALNYINLAKEQPKLFSALFVEKQYENRMLNFSYEYFMKILEKSEKYKDLNEDEVETLLNGTWVVATGVANLSASGTIKPTDDQKIQLMKDSISAMLSLDHKLKLSF